jgi:hypothetical protein
MADADGTPRELHGQYLEIATPPIRRASCTRAP